jgi:membrane associated rhomboid family serine protease
MSATETLTLTAMLLLSGGLSSWLVQLVKRAHWSARRKYLLALALSAAVGLATAWLAGDVLGLVDSWGQLTAAQVLAFLGGVYAAANGFYALWFKTRPSRS